MTSIIETIQTGVSNRIPQHQVSASNKHTENRKEDSFTQVLKHPETQRKIQAESETTSKSIDKRAEISSDSKKTSIPKVGDSSKEQQQTADIEAANNGMLVAKQDKEAVIDLASEALLQLANEGQENASVILANSLFEVEKVVVVPTKAAKGGNSLPVLEPKQAVPVYPLPVTQATTKHQPIEALAKTPAIERTPKSGTLTPIPTVLRDNQFSEIDVSQNNIEIKKVLPQTSPDTAIGKEFNLTELNLSDLMGKYSATNNKALSNRVVNIETLTDIRTETKAETQPISATATNNLQSHSLSVQRTEASHLSFTMQTAYKPGSRDWSESFSRNIALMALNNNKTAEIRMDPPDLGSIQVKINQLVNETNIQFQVQHTDTKQAIEASIQRLKESLAEQGFVNINVDIQQGEQSKSEDDRTAQEPGLKTTKLTADVASSEDAMVLLQPVANTGIDFFA